VLRRQFPKRYHVDEEKALSTKDVRELPPTERLRISRDPLTAQDIKALIDTAVDLHSRALEQQRDKRWLVTMIASASGGLVGALVGALLKN
jgi:hypothetical protein